MGMEADGGRSMASRGGMSSGDYDSLHRHNVELLRQVNHLSMLREVGLAIGASLDPGEALPLIANVVQGALEVSRLTIFELDKDGRMARPMVAKYGRDLITRDRLEEEEEMARGTALGEAAQRRRVVIEDGDLGSRAYVPLLAKDTLVGVMRLEAPLDGREFRDEDTGVFQDVGAQIAIAIHNAHLYAMAVTDGLTGLYVRRYFDLRMEEEFDQARRYGRRFSLALLDVDHFKRFNDEHGHQTGDRVLRDIAALLRANTRRSDICCRYGGEEMAVVLPETGLNEAAILATKLCARIREHELEKDETQRLRVTASIGVAEFREDWTGPGDMVAAADAALYRAKELGRNRVELAGI